MWLLSKAALLPTQIWEIPEDLEISSNTREADENTTQGETSATSKNVFSSKRVFPLSLLVSSFPKKNHVFEATFSDRYAGDN